MTEQNQTKFKNSIDDKNTTITELKQMVDTFVDERDWEKYHTPKNLAISICIEAAELLEHFPWSPPAHEEIDEEKKQMISEELSDVMAYLLGLATILDIDVSSSMVAKMKKNREKYPAEDFHGNWKKPETSKKV